MSVAIATMGMFTPASGGGGQSQYIPTAMMNQPAPLPTIEVTAVYTQGHDGIQVESIDITKDKDFSIDVNIFEEER